MIAHLGALSSVWTPFVAGALAAIGLVPLYVRGVGRLPGADRRGHRTLAFLGGIVTLVTVLSPPVERAADSLFMVHMAQHLLLLVAAPILFLTGHAGRSLIMGLPRSWRRLSRSTRRAGMRAMTLLARTPVEAVTFAVVLWVWHLPAPYDTAARQAPVHLVEHGTFLLAGLLFWAGVMDRRREFLRRSLLVFVTAFHTGLLGAILVFAPVPLYRAHLDQTLIAISPLTDQQLAGMVMWIPMGAVFLVTLAALLHGALSGSGTEEVATDA